MKLRADWPGTAMITALLVLAPGISVAEDYYRKTLGYRTEPASDPPPYVRALSKTPFEQFRDNDWLDVGLELRTRYEFRENDYRPVPTGSTTTSQFRPDTDNLFLLRTRAYLGVHDILDPLRFAVEFQDSRSYNGLYERNTNDVNEFELIQGYGELYFDDLLGEDRPVSVRAGRQHLELLDRRLIANNEFRNTTNNFEGFRVQLGSKQNDWQIDAIGLQPVTRLKYDFDERDSDQWVYGAVFNWRRWSEHVTLQPYFLGRKQRGDVTSSEPSSRKPDIDIYAPGLRAYGLFGDSGFDFDVNVNKQFGEQGRIASGTQVMQDHDALAYAIEVGYTADLAWKPRFSLFYGYGSGDDDPRDAENNRFDPLFGFNQPWSRNDYFSWDNLRTPKARVEFTPVKDLRVDMGYNAYWLASDTDGFRRANLRDQSGNSGDFIGQEFDIRVRHKLNPFVDWSVSYGRFQPGEFTRSFDDPLDGPFTDEASNFFYFEVVLNAFGDGKPR
jgi:hypothetical protein